LKRNTTGVFTLTNESFSNFPNVNTTARISLAENLQMNITGSYISAISCEDDDFTTFSRIGFGSSDGKQTIDYIRVWKTANATIEVGALDSVNATYLVEKSWKTPVSWWINNSFCLDNSWAQQIRVMTFENLSAPEEFFVNESFSNGTVCWNQTTGWKNISGKNVSCMSYESNEEVNGSFWFLGSEHNPNVEHFEGWENSSGNWTKFANYSFVNESQWWVNYIGLGQCFLICKQDGREKYYVVVPPTPPEDTSNSGGKSSGGGGWTSTPKISEEVVENETSFTFEEMESIINKSTEIIGIKSFEVMGNISMSNKTLHIWGVGIIELRNNFILINESGNVLEGRVFVTTGEYILESREISSKENKNVSVVGGGNGVELKNNNNLELGVGMLIIILLIFLGSLASI